MARPKKRLLPQLLQLRIPPVLSAHHTRIVATKVFLCCVLGLWAIFPYDYPEYR